MPPAKRRRHRVRGAVVSVGPQVLLGLLAVRRLARLRPGLVNAAGTALWGAATLPLALIGALPAARRSPGPQRAQAISQAAE
jgi:hypothetical protein